MGGNMFWVGLGKKKKKTCRVQRERQTSADIFWLQLKEQLSHAPLCVVSCFTSVHNEQNYPSLSFSWRKSIIHITGRARRSKNSAYTNSLTFLYPIRLE